MFIDMSIEIVNVFWLLSYLHPSVSDVVCGGLNGRKCCSGFTGYVWNETVHNCTRCTSGSHGENCASPCPFPHYGYRCGLQCNCNEDECHHQYGCKRSYGEGNGTTWDEKTGYSPRLDELDADSKSCVGKGNFSTIKGYAETLRYAIIGLGLVCCVFLIFYIGLHIDFNRHIPEVKDIQDHERQINV
ncbi:uncharacterized protein LOC125675233 isoform X1 [Ostrea edulis]|uniref:uncharacterized protein LOC125675233 isoform X1 n=1 Tax=Ostrea edulis TaxID=37623 RepID=UPI0024AFB0D3|nr:uncharacterized protein LOC125675233 isoform X1 [Ostrea edulis]